MDKKKDMSDALPQDQTKTRLNPRQDSSETEYRASNKGAESQPQNWDPMIALTIADRYKIERLIGEGGMAKVYEAKHIVLKKRVAIKMLHRSTALNKETIIRFQQEASGLSHLQHPNIVSISDFGMAETGHPYCVMDLIEGKSLADLIQEGGIKELKQLAKLFSEVCGALAYAHKKNIIHRDIKPSNIICIEDDGQLTAKLIDFGIAKFGEFQEQDLTRTGAIFGSPFYMSPEQCAGRRLDQRSDIYSLGCTMYEAITGRPPFVGESALQTLSMHTLDKPMAPHLLRSDLPMGLEKIVLKCLTKLPEERYQSVLDLQNDINKVDLRTARKRLWDRCFRSAIIGIIAIASIGLFTTVLRLNDKKLDDEKLILRAEDIGQLRDLINKNRDNPHYSKRLLAALYYRLITLDGSTGSASLEKDSVEAYTRIVETPPKDISFYSFKIAAYLGYFRFCQHRLHEATNMELKALEIFEQARDNSIPCFELTSQLPYCSCMIITGYRLEQPVDLNKIDAEVVRARRIWKKIADRIDKGQLPTCGGIFTDMAQHCEKVEDLPAAISCYEEAANIFAAIPDNAQRISVDEKRRELSAQLRNSVK
jgi:serine/threonine protein kinase